MAKVKIYYNADIVTMDESAPSAEAICVKKGLIEALGTKEDLMKNYSKAELVDMQGNAILPGFIDGHSHMLATAFSMMLGNANPSPQGSCDSVEQLVSELSKQIEEWQKTAAKGEFFIAMGYDNAVYPDKRTPSKYDLDKISADVPIVVVHASGHCAVLNSKAMELCGITNDTPVPDGGGMPKIPGTDEYSGEMQENAFFALSSKMKNPGIGKILAYMEKCEKMYASYGITTAQDAKLTKGQKMLIALKNIKKPFNIDVVLYADPEIADSIPKQDPRKNPYKKHIRYGGYKIFLDGSPQAKTAWLTKPYYEVPEGKDEDYCGYPTQTDEEVCAHINRCLENNWQINAHTNGDAAIDQFIRCYKKCKAEHPDVMDLRPVSIHCQTAREDQLDEIKEIGMIISFFCDHVYYWGDYHYASVLGPERGERISPVRSAIDRGINFTLHQDTPVVKPNVIFAIHNAVNRMTRGGRLLGAEQRISVYEALKGVTVNGAYQIFEEQRKGSLTAGKLADMVVLDRNPLKSEPEMLKDIQVLETIKEGKTVYKK